MLFHTAAASYENEIPKIAHRDRPRDWHVCSPIRDTETTRRLANAPYSRAFRVRSEYCVKPRTCWLGWEDSNFGIRRRPGAANQALTLKRCANRSLDIHCGNDWTSAANRASVSSC